MASKTGDIIKMVKITIEDEDGQIVEISRDIGPSYVELVNLFYSVSLGMGYSQKTVDDYIDCEYNDFAVSNKRGEE